MSGAASRFWVAALPAMATVLLAARSVASDQPYKLAETHLRIGMLTSMSHYFNGADYLGLGGRVGLEEGREDSYWGGYLEGQALGWVNDLDAYRDWHPRVGLGFSGGWTFVGFESGLALEGAHRFGERTFAPTMMLTGAPVIRLMYATVALRVGMPLAALSERERAGVEVGGAFTLSLPLTLDRSVYRSAPRPGGAADATAAAPATAQPAQLAQLFDGRD